MVLRLKARESRSPPGPPTAPHRQPPTPPSSPPHPRAGWSSPVARQAHNLKVAGSNPAPATKLPPISTTYPTAPASPPGRSHLCPHPVRSAAAAKPFLALGCSIAGDDPKESPHHQSRRRARHQGRRRPGDAHDRAISPADTFCQVAKSKAWPDSPRALARRLQRAATFLRKVGIEISFEFARARILTRMIRHYEWAETIAPRSRRGTGAVNATPLRKYCADNIADTFGSAILAR